MGTLDVTPEGLEVNTLGVVFRNNGRRPYSQIRDSSTTSRASDLSHHPHARPYVTLAKQSEQQ